MTIGLNVRGVRLVRSGHRNDPIARLKTRPEGEQ